MNNYHIYEAIGRGKHSVVYKGRKKKTIHYYAIKSVEKTQKDRVLQEVRTMHHLDHPHILKFFQWYETQNHLWLILEYCVGGDLMSLLRQDMRLPENSIHDFGRDLVMAMQFLHHNSIIYCDLKPSNILLDENGRIKLGGFGLSRRLSDINRTPVESLQPAKRGTPSYMAPELFQSGATHSTKADLWALGCVLYECSAGRPPFSSTSFNRLTTDILNHDPEPLRGASPEFADLVMRLLDKNPATRLGWDALCNHAFWKVKLPRLPVPAEPALDAFIAANSLAPQPSAAADDTESAQRGALARQSVNVLRLSQIARNNLERESESAEQSQPGVQPHAQDIQLDSHDAELNFEEQPSEGGDAVDGDASPSEWPSSSSSSSTATDVSGDPQIDNSAGPSRSLRNSGMPAKLNPPPGVSQPESAAAAAESRSGGGVPVGRGVEELLWQGSDASVKPIIGNRRIERWQEPSFNASQIPFPCYTLEQMLALQTPELESFLTDIYRQLGSVAPVKDKVAALSYFETLCTSDRAANILVNTSLMILFIRMLGNRGTPTLRVRLASVLGLLIRHATYITGELANKGIVSVLTEALRDGNPRVRRRVMAALGELLFYIATQQDAPGQPVSSAWTVPPNTIAMISHVLRPGQDEVVQHYAVKTIENITAKDSEWARRFATQEVMDSVLLLFRSSGGEQLRCTAGSTLGRLLRLDQALLMLPLERSGIRMFVDSLSIDSNNRIQASCINVLNIILTSPELLARAAQHLQDDQRLVPAVVALLDHSAPTVRGKAMLCVALLARQGPRYLLEACQLRMVPVLSRHTTDPEAYVQSCAQCVCAELTGQVPALLQQINAALEQAGAQQAPGHASGSGGSHAVSPRPGSGGPAPLLEVLLHLLTSPHFRPLITTPALLAALSSYLTTAFAPGAAFAGIQETKVRVLHALEAVSQQAELLVAQSTAVVELLMPALSQVAGQAGESGDTRFFCLRILTQALHALLQAQATASAPPHFVSEAKLDSLLQSSILPLVPELVLDEDPMPLYAQKLLVSIMEVRPEYVSAMQSLNLIPQLFSFLSIDHPNNNVHNIRLCKAVLGSGLMPASAIRDMDVVNKVMAVLEYAHDNSVEPFLEPVVELCLALLESDAAAMQQQQPHAGNTARMASSVPVLLHLCTWPDASLPVVASQCVRVLQQVFPGLVTNWVLLANGAAYVSAALRGGLTDSDATTAVPVALTQQLLATLSLACDAASGMALRADEHLVSLLQTVQALEDSSEPSVKKAAVEVREKLQPLLATA